MGNNWIVSVDPDGQFVFALAITIGAIIGAGINVATHWDQITAGGQFNWAKFGAAALIGGVAGGIGVATAGTAFAAAGGAAAGVGAFWQELLREHQVVPMPARYKESEMLLFLETLFQ